MNDFKDRIKELRRVKAKTLVNNPLNWRVHPEKQKKLLQNVLDDIGFADALIAREDSNGKLILIDGHLRAEINPDQDVPVLILDVSEQEANKLLFVLDPVTELAKTNMPALKELIQQIDINEQSVQNMIQLVENETKLLCDDMIKKDKTLIVHDMFQVIVECCNEDEQKLLFDELVAKGKKCKLLTL